MRTRGAKIRSRARAFAPACAIITVSAPRTRAGRAAGGRWGMFTPSRPARGWAKVRTESSVSSFKEFSQYDAIGLAELIQARRGQRRRGRRSRDPARRTAESEAQRRRSRRSTSGRESARRIRLPWAGPLGGVPMLLKDLLSPLAGAPFTSGSRFYQGVVPDYDAELVRRYERAGLNIVGKTSTPEFGIMPVCGTRALRSDAKSLGSRAYLRGARAAARLRRLRQASCRSPMVATAGARCAFRLRAVGCSRSNPRAEGIPPGPTRASTRSGSPSNTSSLAVCATVLWYSISSNGPGADVALLGATGRSSVPQGDWCAERKAQDRLHRSPAPPRHRASRLPSRAPRTPSRLCESLGHDVRGSGARHRLRAFAPRILHGHLRIRSRRASTSLEEELGAGPRSRRARDRHVARRHARRRALGG